MTEPYQDLITAARDGNLNEVMTLVNLYNPEIVDALKYSDHTALSNAAYNGHTAVFKYLLQAYPTHEARVAALQERET